jgi:hypothetical protein
MKVKKVSQIFGKSVISSSGKEGYVLGFIRDKNQITALICADENEKRFSILPEKLEGDKIFYDKKIATCSGGKGISLGKPAFNLSGKYLGKLYDYVCSGLCLTKACIGKKHYPLEQIVEGDIILVKDEATHCTLP